LGESRRRFGGGAQEGLATKLAHSITRVGVFPDTETTIDESRAFSYRRAVQADKESWLLKLYVAGSGRLATSARANLERLCRENIKSHYRIEVIDLLQHPARARARDRRLAHRGARGAGTDPQDRRRPLRQPARLVRAAVLGFF